MFNKNGEHTMKNNIFKKLTVITLLALGTGSTMQGSGMFNTAAAAAARSALNPDGAGGNAPAPASVNKALPTFGSFSTHPAEPVTQGNPFYATLFAAWLSVAAMEFGAAMLTDVDQGAVVDSRLGQWYYENCSDAATKTKLRDGAHENQLTSGHYRRMVLGDIGEGSDQRTKITDALRIFVMKFRKDEMEMLRAVYNSVFDDDERFNVIDFTKMVNALNDNGNKAETLFNGEEVDGVNKATEGKMREFLNRLCSKKSAFTVREKVSNHLKNGSWTMKAVRGVRDWTYDFVKNPKVKKGFVSLIGAGTMYFATRFMGVHNGIAAPLKNWWSSASK